MAEKANGSGVGSGTGVNVGMNKQLPYIKVFPKETLELIELLSDVEKGRLFEGMLQYATSGEDQQFHGSEKYVWVAIRQQLDRNIEAYLNKVEANRKNGATGGRPKKKI